MIELFKVISIIVEMLALLSAKQSDDDFFFELVRGQLFSQKECANESNMCREPCEDKQTKNIRAKNSGSGRHFLLQCNRSCGST